MADGWRATLLVDNLALAAGVSASSQAQNMPASNLLTPHTTERWRGEVSSAFFVVDMGSQVSADTFMAKGLTGTQGIVARLHLSAIDVAGSEVFDSGPVSNGSQNLDIDYGAGCGHFRSR